MNVFVTARSSMVYIPFASRCSLPDSFALLVLPGTSGPAWTIHEGAMHLHLQWFSDFGGVEAVRSRRPARWGGSRHGRLSRVSLDL